jgi:hypothetical protein
MASYLPEGISLEISLKDSLLRRSGPGVKPLLELIAEGQNCEGATLRDRVTGRAAALLYLYLGIKEVKSDLISSGALSLLEENGVRVFFNHEIPAILNHSRTDLCPLEKACEGISSPVEGLKRIQETLKKMAEK